MNSSMACVSCAEAVESTMHFLRDYVNARQLWDSFQVSYFFPEFYALNPQESFIKNFSMKDHIGEEQN